MGQPYPPAQHCHMQNISQGFYSQASSSTYKKPTLEDLGSRNWVTYDKRTANLQKRLSLRVVQNNYRLGAQRVVEAGGYPDTLPRFPLFCLPRNLGFMSPTASYVFLLERTRSFHPSNQIDIFQSNCQVAQVNVVDSNTDSLGITNSFSARILDHVLVYC